MSTLEVLGIILFATGGFFKKPRITLGIYTFSNLLFLIAYFELGLFMACISLALTSVRGVAALFLNKEQNKHSVIFFTLAIISLIALEINHYADLLIVIAAIAAALSAYFRDHLQLFWAGNFASCFLWIIHSLIFGMYGMIICCAVIIASGLFAVFNNAYFSSLRATSEFTRASSLTPRTAVSA